MTPEQHQELLEVNRATNEIPSDTVTGAGEDYDYWHDTPAPGRSWVCRDYVLLKAEKLRDLGWPQTALSVVLAWTEPVGEPPKPEYHAVLGVQLPGEAVWILDSRFAEPYPMDRPVKPYRWDRRQIPGTTSFEPVA